MGTPPMLGYTPARFAQHVKDEVDLGTDGQGPGARAE
jgi:hypothetical protein